MKKSSLAGWCAVITLLALTFGLGHEVGYYRGYLAGATRVLDRVDEWIADLKK